MFAREHRHRRQCAKGAPLSVARLSIVAETGGEFEDFGPFVPAINDAGFVTFQVTLRGGAQRVARWREGGLLELASVVYGGEEHEVCSHPDEDDDGGVVCYARAPRSGVFRVVVQRQGQTYPLADTEGELQTVGPLGPTVNGFGTVAFRGSTRGAGPSLFLGRQGRVACIASAERFAAFHGLPVVRADDAVIFRATDKDGAESLYLRTHRALEILARTGGAEGLSALGRFPSANDRGGVAFVGTLEGDAGDVVFVAEASGLRRVVSREDGFVSLRGALINNRGTIVFYGTPRDGTLGVYVLSPSGPRRLLGLGDTLWGTVVSDFALNPVSFNHRDAMAIRLRGEDGRGFIAHAELAPVAPSLRGLV